MAFPVVFYNLTVRRNARGDDFKSQVGPLIFASWRTLMPINHFEGKASEQSFVARKGDFAKIEEIAIRGNDGPVLMVNLNKYLEGEYPNGSAYNNYMKALDILLKHVGGRVLWRTPVYGQPRGTRPLDEMLGIWYPSHKSFLALRDQGEVSEENFQLRNLVIEHADIYRCPHDGIPNLSTPQATRKRQDILSEFQAQGFEIDDDHASLGMVYTDRDDVN